MNQTVLVCGGRGYGNRALLYDVLDVAHAANPIVGIVHGGAAGADALAGAWARDNGCPEREYLADWDALGRAAGPLRNQKMLDETKPDLVIAFPGGAGTADMVRRAKAAKVPVVMVRG